METQQMSRQHTVYADASLLGKFAPAIPQFAKNLLVAEAGKQAGKPKNAAQQPITAAVIDKTLSALFATYHDPNCAQDMRRKLDTAISETVQAYIRATGDVDLYAHVPKNGPILEPAALS